MTDTATRDPETIERDIRRTQDRLSDTVDRIGDQLSGRNILNALFDKTGTGKIDADTVIDTVRRNPLAVAMIAGGAIWLLSDSDAKLSSLGIGKGDKPDHDPHHRDYVSHMGSVQWQEGEDPLAYQRRRDIARANYFMVERRHEEDESGFRQRLDEVADAFREKRRAWSEQGHDAAVSVGEAGQRALRGAQQGFTSNPLLGGIAAAAVGAIFGTVLPLTQTEQDKLGDIGEKARDLAGEQKDKLTEAVREKKDELVEKVEQNAQPDEQRRQGGSAQAGAGSDFPANDRGAERYQEAASQPPTRQPDEDEESLPSSDQHL
ncbi:MAG: DUF3618 domain-containing protein [Novosphingobium sp.]|nr:DUF3618 domain-containing protein [Novosphingobium sp.]